MQSPTKRRSASPARSPLVQLANLSLGANSAKSTRSYKAKSRPGSTKGSPTKRDSRLDGGFGRMDIVGAFESSTGHSPKRKKSFSGKYDRFIPNREAMGTAIPQNGNTSGSDDSLEPTVDTDNGDEQHTANLTASLGLDLGRRILSFSAEPPPSATEPSSLLAKAQTAAKGKKADDPQTRRRIATMPTRVLDAPGLLDDYYLNLLDWSSTNLLAIGLDTQVYIWNSSTGAVSLLCDLAPSDESTSAPEGTDDYVCSVRFADDGSYLAVGTSLGPIQIYEVATGNRIRTMSGRISRIPTLAWSGAVLSSGARDGGIWNHDVRVQQHKISEMGTGHRAEVCGLEWRPETRGGLSGGGMGMLASGGNDNVVNVWDARNPAAAKMTKNNHTAAVKALAWCPWQSSLLASGGGSNDKVIHFWQTTTSARLASHTTNSQVTSLVFNPHAREIMSTHGFPDHQIAIWSYPTLSKVAEITQAHDTRILHSALSPDGCVVASAASDENLKFWTLFDRPAKPKAGSSTASGKSEAKRTAIR